jgi:hypothetical protein
MPTTQYPGGSASYSRDLTIDPTPDGLITEGRSKEFPVKPANLK